MDRPGRFEDHRWVGDKRNQRVHDVDNTTDACRLDELLAGVVDAGEARLAFRAAFPRLQARVTVSGAAGEDLEARLAELRAELGFEPSSGMDD